MPKGIMSWKKLGVLSALVVLLALCLVLIVDQAILPAIVGSGNVVIVPDVVGKNVDAASSELMAMGLQVPDATEQYSETVVKGRVISQMPYAKATVKQGRRIYLTVSRGIETIKMPTLTNRTLRDARLALMRIGLQLGDVTYEYNDSIPSDYIIAQGVPVGAEIPAGGTTSVVISRGKGSVVMPDLLGMNYTEAEALVLERGLSLGQVRHMSSGTFEPNTVIGQEPSADTPVVPGTAVSLILAK